MELLIATIGGLVGGGVVLGIEQLIIYLKDRNKEKRQKLIAFPNPNRIIDESIFDRLAPGRSVELMKAVLGTPDNTFVDAVPIFETYREEEEGLMAYEFESEEDKATFEENRLKTTAYIYDFENARVKITSKDKETINSLAVEVKDDFSLDISNLPLWFEPEDELPYKLGSARVAKELVDTSRPAYEFSRYDNIFVLSIYTAGPLYTHYSYFGFPDNGLEEVSAESPETFIGCTIRGICLHRDEFDCYVPRGWDYL